MNSWLLDVTRIASRLGRGALTGIDRVELAYLRHLLQPQFRTYGLLRTKAGVLLLNRTGLSSLDRWASGAPLPQDCDLMAKATRRNDPLLGAIETQLRKTSIARAPVSLSHFALRRHLPQHIGYLNTGHANLSAPMMRALRSVSGMKIGVLVHDTIPLDHPAYSRPDRIDAFAKKLRAVSDSADLVIHTAQATRTSTDAHFRQLGRVPNGVVAPLGVDVQSPNAAELPPDLPLEQPFFLAVGTIEPRKNHALLLDVWERLAGQMPDPPKLFIVGNKGWADAAILARLETGLPGVHVLHGVSDAAVAALMCRARALLFPTLSEGFGLPAFEAASLGLPVIATELPVFREILNDYPVYLAPHDIYSWQETVLALTEGSAFGRKGRWTVPRWEDHFSTALKAFE